MNNLQLTASNEVKLTLCETCFYGYFYPEECSAPLPSYVDFKQRKPYRNCLKEKACKKEYCCYYKRYLRTEDYYSKRNR